MHRKRVSKDFEAGKLDEYHDLYPKSDTLILTDVSENFRIFFKKTHLDSVKFLSNPGLASQRALKKTMMLLMLLMVHKGIRCY